MEKSFSISSKVVKIPSHVKYALPIAFTFNNPLQPNVLSLYLLKNVSKPKIFLRLKGD